MREFIYFSGKAVTSGNFTDLMKAGRMDIASHIIIHSFFISNAIRNNITTHLFFYGPPDPPKHLEIVSRDSGTEISISKKDVIGLIKRMLYKYKKGKKNEALSGCFVEKKSLLSFVEELKEDGREIYLLDGKGEDIREAEIGENPIFILGDHSGIPSKEKRRLKKLVKTVSIGKTTYFASQTMAILQNELDRRRIY